MLAMLFARSDRGAGTRAVGASVRGASALPAIDYADRFTLRTDVVAAPEEWARAMFGNEPKPGETFLWRGLLGLRLVPAAPDVVAGWRIDGRGADWIRLATRSWFLRAELVVAASGGEVALTTMLHYARVPAWLIWPPLSVVHRGLAPGVLLAAEAVLSRRAKAAPAAASAD